MIKRHFIPAQLLILLLFCLSSVQDNVKLSVTAKGAVLEKLAGGFSFTEGPAPDGEGNVYFTDQPNDRIMKWSINDELSTFMQPSGRSNGMFTDNKGILWSCADSKNELWKIGPDKKIEVVAGSFEDRPFNGPNDVWVSPAGGIYITDPFYLRPWWDHTKMPQLKERVYYIDPDKKTVKAVIDDLQKPNGIVGSPDGKTLYIADIGGNKTWRYSIKGDGSLTDKTFFCEPGSDGMTMDEKGNIYLTGNGVIVFDSTGKKIGNIPVPEKWTANVCFGGKDHKSLFITATTGLYRVKMKVRGAF